MLAGLACAIYAVLHAMRGSKKCNTYRKYVSNSSELLAAICLVFCKVHISSKQQCIWLVLSRVKVQPYNHSAVPVLIVCDALLHVVQ